MQFHVLLRKHRTCFLVRLVVRLLAVFVAVRYTVALDALLERVRRLPALRARLRRCG